jgi:hypothetical protein
MSTMTIPLRTRIIFLVWSAFLLGAPQAAFAQCSQTLNVGDDVASAVFAAASDSTICLNGGDYGTVNFDNVVHSGFVTVRSTSGISARMSPEISASTFIRFQSMTLTNMDVNSCSTNIHILNSTFVPQTAGLLFNYISTCPGVTDMGLLIDGTTFDRVQQANFEGRLSIRGVRGLTVSNSVFSGEPTLQPSDGIQIVGDSTNIQVGPGNVFTGILEALCGDVHCDAIQDYGGGPNNHIVGNRFENGDTYLMFPDGSDSYTIENNIFDGTLVDYSTKIQLGGSVNAIFRHNTLKNVISTFDSKTPSANALIENNIYIDNGGIFATGCSGCTIRFNLYSSSLPGTHNVVGTPAFIAGSWPTPWAGWRLAAGSFGKNAANDGQDIGTTYYGPSTGTPVLSAPATVQVVR